MNFSRGRSSSPASSPAGSTRTRPPSTIYSTTSSSSRSRSRSTTRRSLLPPSAYPYFLHRQRHPPTIEESAAASGADPPHCPTSSVKGSSSTSSSTFSAPSPAETPAVSAVSIPPPVAYGLLARVRPRFLRHLLGYRTPQELQAKEPKALFRPLNYLSLQVETYLSAFCSALISLLFVLLLFTKTPFLQNGGTGSERVLIVGSFGATAVLLSGTPTSPLAQPKNVFFGQVISAVIGCSIARIFEYCSPERFNLARADGSGSIVFFVGGFAMALALLAMMATGTTHPPGGATALLAVTSSQVLRIHFYYIPMVMISSIIMLTVALISTNLTRRRYPLYWWRPPDASKGRYWFSLDPGPGNKKVVVGGESKWIPNVVLRAAKEAKSRSRAAVGKRSQSGSPKGGGGRGVAKEKEGLGDEGEWVDLETGLQESEATKTEESLSSKSTEEEEQRGRRLKRGY